ncbi:probable glucuronosyltransferase Os03g0287800 [Phragmites australis]|uniref:probable glucuronosyltransferase Os03g0287800 n=1 Tax=Phragmites australis TaxID=29695 RepID=UPI002D794164|nr:probable glucuronosyltransferase Os03g0287800 [Phragmites australis]
MGSSADHGGAGGRAKKQGSQLWKKALLHSCLCFVMGFFTGFAPSSVSDWTSAAVSAGGVGTSHVVRALQTAAGGAVNRSLLAQDAVGGAGVGDAAASPRPLLVLVTTTESMRAGERAAALTRMAHTLRLVAPPLLWVVVEAAPDVPATARLLRATGLMYRHLTYKDNFTAADAAAGKERHHQRYVALGHIERHRLSGVVLFAGLGDAFDLRFFDELRQISTFGAWPVATMSRDERKVVVRGPACSSSAVTGWFSWDFSNDTAAAASAARPREVDVHGFAFNSSVLWDPERWGRYPTSEPDKSQDSMKFVQEVVLEDFSKVKRIPSDCSEVMVWHVDTMAPSSSSQMSLRNKRR